MELIKEEEPADQNMENEEAEVSEFQQIKFGIAAVKAHSGQKMKGADEENLVLNSAEAESE